MKAIQKKNARMKKYKYEAGRDIVDKCVNDGSIFLNIWGFLIEIIFLANVKFSTRTCTLINMYVCSYKR